MKVVQVVPSLSQSTGGLFVSISHLARYSMKDGTAVTICGPREEITAAEEAAWGPAEICTYPQRGPKRLAYAPALVKGLGRIAPDLVHAHGLWTYTTVAAAFWGRKYAKPYVVSIHGMLEPWSLQRSRIRKWFARRLYQDAILERAGCLRATSQMEADNIRAAGLRTPIAVVANGVTLPPRPEKDARPPSRKTRHALFISRLHPKKGLMNLIAAWNELRPKDWKLTIIGPGEASYVNELRQAISSAGLDQSIELLDPVWGEERFRYYWAADLFVFPSFSENFAMVVAEALACELPVITTKGLPWPDLQRHECGWWIDIGLEPLIEALRAAIALSDAERAEMGRRGRELIAREYTWDLAAEKMAMVYRWLTGSERPDWVEITAR